MNTSRMDRGVMLSSTFSDLRYHRQAAIQAIHKAGLSALVMEFTEAASATDVIDLSLKMVRDAVLFIGIIGHRYGRVPLSPLNPDGFSFAELEFNEALRLQRPMLLFAMSDDHLITTHDIERDPEKIQKLSNFRSRIKKLRSDSAPRIYESFHSAEDFEEKFSASIARFAQTLDEVVSVPFSNQMFDPGLPQAPRLRAHPAYLGSGKFVGRAAELRELDEWGGDSDPHPMMLIAAIGGAGKSQLSWNWLNFNAPLLRRKFQGRFWYSFYEHGAVMAGFCRHALAYIENRPFEDFASMRMPEVAARLLDVLQAAPWLLVLDGIERILVAYHRFDASHLNEDAVDGASDQIANRDPRHAIRPEDDELLRALSAAAPSRILVTSRLTPSALMTRSGSMIHGVRAIQLGGLRLDEGEQALRAVGIDGDSVAMRQYIQANCAGHPLTVGVLAGIINRYPAAPGDFDRWFADPKGGSAIELGGDFIQRRNLIFDTALDDLPPDSLQLLETLSLLDGGADYAMLVSLAEGWASDAS